jgi:hypothetical protein
MQTWYANNCFDYTKLPCKIAHQSNEAPCPVRFATTTNFPNITLAIVLGIGNTVAADATANSYRTLLSRTLRCCYRISTLCFLFFV